MLGPDPLDKHPLKGFPRVCFLKSVINNPQISIGDYTYYDDPAGGDTFEKNVLYLYPFTGDKLIIGKFCAIATGARFIMNGAYHYSAGFSTYPFDIFGNGWEKDAPALNEYPHKGDTVIGHDVWIGYEAIIMAGVQVGNGAIIGTGSLVTQNVPPYSVVGGNPARVIRYRFDPDTIEELEEIAWWDWPVNAISENIGIIRSANIGDLREVAKNLELL